MASPTPARRRLTSVVTGPRRTPSEKLELIAELLADPTRITPAMLRIKILAICEGRTLPTDKKGFLALATRAGVRHARRYDAWRELAIKRAQEDPATADSPIAVTIRDIDNRPLRIATTPREVAETRVAAKQAQAVAKAARTAARPPRGTALYRWYDEAGLLLYVGISDELPGRVNSHIKDSSWMEFAVRSTIERCADRTEAISAEIEAIKTERPLFNEKHNNTPAARRRLVEYLIEHDRIDLLAPAVSRG